MKKMFIAITLFILFIMNSFVFADTNALSITFPELLTTIQATNEKVGITDVYPITMKNLLSTPYTVPNGYSFFITSIKNSSENDDIKIKQSIAAPTTILTSAAQDSAGALAISDTKVWYYRVEFYSRYAYISSGYGDTYNQLTVTPRTDSIVITAIPTSTNRLTTARKIWRSNDNSTYYLLTTINDNTTTTYNDSTNETALALLSVYSAPAAQSYMRIVEGKTNGVATGSQSSISLKNPFMLMEFDVMTSATNNAVVSGILFPSSNIYITRNKLSSNNYVVPDTNVLVITNFYMPRSSDSMRVKWSADAPSTLTANDSKSGAMESGVYYYKYTFNSTLLGVESELSDSTAVTVSTGDTGSVGLTSIDTSTKGYVDSRKIYRSRVDSPNTFFYLGTISDNTTTSYTDTINDTELGAAYSENKNINIASQYMNYNLNTISGESFGGTVFVNEQNVLSATNDNALFNGYLAEIK